MIYNFQLLSMKIPYRRFTLTSSPQYSVYISLCAWLHMSMPLTSFQGETLHSGQGSELHGTVSLGLTDEHSIDSKPSMSWHTTFLLLAPPPHVLEHCKTSIINSLLINNSKIVTSLNFTSTIFTSLQVY